MTRSEIIRQRVLEREEADAREQRRRKERLLEALVRAQGGRYDPAEVSLTTYVATHPGQAATLAKAKALAARLPEAVAAGESLLIYGLVGVGKDHLAASLAHLAAGTHGIGVEWWRGQELCNRLRDAVRNDGLAALLRRLVEAPVLMVSDPYTPAGDMTEWCAAELHGVIDTRYCHRRPTWITMNAVNEEEVKGRLSLQTFDRLRHGGHIWPCFWPSHRAG